MRTSYRPGSSPREADRSCLDQIRGGKTTAKSICVPSPSVTDLDAAALMEAVKITRKPGTIQMRIIRIWWLMNSVYHYSLRDRGLGSVRLDGWVANRCAMNKNVSKSLYTIVLAATSWNGTKVKRT
jgi:hypothetical protein